MTNKIDDQLPDPAAEAEARDLVEHPAEPYIKPALGLGATGVPMEGTEPEPGGAEPDPAAGPELPNDLPYPLTFCLETTPRGRWLKCEPFGGTALMIIVERDEEYWARPEVHDRYPVGMIIAVGNNANVLMIEDVDSGMPTWRGFFVSADDIAGSIEVSGELP